MQRQARGGVPAGRVSGNGGTRTRGGSTPDEAEPVAETAAEPAAGPAAGPAAEPAVEPKFAAALLGPVQGEEVAGNIALAAASAPAAKPAAAVPAKPAKDELRMNGDEGPFAKAGFYEFNGGYDEWVAVIPAAAPPVATPPAAPKPGGGKAMADELKAKLEKKNADADAASTAVQAQVHEALDTARAEFKTGDHAGGRAALACAEQLTGELGESISIIYD